MGGILQKRILRREKEYKYYMKKSLFTVLLCFLSVFCPFLLAGCGESQVDAEVVNQTNAFRIMRQANDDGSIAVAYIFPINSEIFLQNGLTQNDVNAFRYFLSLNVRAVAEQNRLRAGQGVKVSPVAEFTDIDGFAFSITFADIEAQKEFFGVQDQPQEEEDSSSSTKTSGFFMKKTEISTTFPVSTTQGAENLKQVCTIALTNWASAADYADVETLLQMYEKSNFMYYFSSTQSAIKSELCFDDGVLHHNVFIKSA